MTKHVIITGATRGIGKAILELFLQHGYHCITIARHDMDIQHANITHFIGDLSHEQEVNTLCHAIKDYMQGTPLHALIHNAATSPKTAYKERLGCVNGDMESWHHVFQLNFFTPLMLTRFFAPALIQSLPSGGASIVHISSIAADKIHPFAGAAYACSKAALKALNRELAGEFAEVGVRVNAITPGEIITDMIGPEYAPLERRIPLGRMGSSLEVANVVYQICQDDFSYVTGDNIYLTGGQHLL